MKTSVRKWVGWAKSQMIVEAAVLLPSGSRCLIRQPLPTGAMPQPGSTARISR
jgi:hypothetical protein